MTVLVAETQTISTTENYSACSGTNYDYNGTSIAVGSSESFTFTNAVGCDSIVEVTITAYPELIFAIESTEACANSDSGTLEIVNGLGGGPYLLSLIHI